MRRLEARAAAEDEFAGSDPYSDESASTAVLDDGWQEDAFMPLPLEAPRFHSYPPVYGGYPLLEDVLEAHDADQG
jgi:hypothetical protein